jgi:catechol 2,3-dioxygenase-like lactoylglutathione lyase family enzyme/predicted GNAT family N-acyltransferase
MRIDHVALWTIDLEGLVDFYTSFFDCKASNRYDNTKKKFSSCFLSFTGSTRIEIMKHPDIKEHGVENEKIGLAYLAIQVGTRDKVDSLTKSIENAGFKVMSLPRVTGDGYYESVIHDPDNNTVELVAMNDFKISEATTEDLEEILYLQKCCYLSEAEIYNDYSIPPLTQTLEGIKNDSEKQKIIKLEYENKIIGSVRAFVEDNTCFIGRLIVNRDFQNMGFGRLLMNHIENIFHHVSRFELFTGYKSDKNLYLYKNFGYKIYKEKKMNNTVITYLEKYT